MATAGYAMAFYVTLFCGMQVNLNGWMFRNLTSFSNIP